MVHRESNHYALLSQKKSMKLQTCCVFTLLHVCTVFFSATWLSLRVVSLQTMFSCCPLDITSQWWIWHQRWWKRWRNTKAPSRSSVKAKASDVSCLRGTTGANTFSYRFIQNITSLGVFTWTSSVIELLTVI